MRGRMGFLSSLISDIQAEMNTIQLANAELLRKNDDLVGENIRLKQFLKERASSKELIEDSNPFVRANGNGSPILPHNACFIAAAGA